MLDKNRRKLIDRFAPVIRNLLKTTGVDIPLDVVKQRLLSADAKLDLPDPKTIDRVRLGELDAVSGQTQEVMNGVVTPNSKDLARIRPLSVKIELHQVPKEIIDTIRRDTS